VYAPQPGPVYSSPPGPVYAPRRGRFRIHRPVPCTHRRPAPCTCRHQGRYRDRRQVRYSDPAATSSQPWPHSKCPWGWLRLPRHHRRYRRMMAAPCLGALAWLLGVSDQGREHLVTAKGPEQSPSEPLCYGAWMGEDFGGRCRRVRAIIGVREARAGPTGAIELPQLRRGPTHTDQRHRQKATAPGSRRPPRAGHQARRVDALVRWRTHHRPSGSRAGNHRVRVQRSGAGACRRHGTPGRTGAPRATRSSCLQLRDVQAAQRCSVRPAPWGWSTETIHRRQSAAGRRPWARRPAQPDAAAAAGLSNHRASSSGASRSSGALSGR